MLQLVVIASLVTIPDKMVEHIISHNRQKIQINDGLSGKQGFPLRVEHHDQEDDSHDKKTDVVCYFHLSVEGWGHYSDDYQ